MNIKKLIIIGNGFDLAHNLPTNFYDFVTEYENHPVLKEFERLSKKFEGNGKYLTWYYFEEEMENISNTQFSRSIMNGHTSKDYEEYNQEMEHYNQLFSDLSKLLMKYLSEVYSNSEIKLLSNVKKEFLTEGVYSISFNYTDTVKLYTDKYEYIHGNIEDDGSIVLGFSNDQYPDIATGSYIYFNKSLLRFRLSYRRYLINNGYIEDIENYLKELDPHLYCMYSGKGGWNFPTKIDEKGNYYYDISKASEPLKGFFLQCEEKPDIKHHKFDQVEELVIMGHGLESDKLYFESLSKMMPALKTVTLYTFLNESTESIERKVTYLKNQFKVKKVTLKKYEARKFYIDFKQIFKRFGKALFKKRK